MKLSTLQATLGSAVALLSLPGCDASSAHRRLHELQRNAGHAHGHQHVHETSGAVTKRGGSCQFPSGDPNLVAITPGSKNAGWAMSPDQECKPGNYCPIACKPGMVMAQWDPKSSYTYPASMNGGLYCDNSGQVHKPFPNKPYCVEGTGSVMAVNKCSSPMSWCQTVLPGNEAMLIPTLVNSISTIAVPDTSYWAETAAHFYINPPGVGTEGCIWGDPTKPIGNWSPYVAGANTDGSGQTFVKIGLNPIYQASALNSKSPTYGVRIECPGGGCNGLPCEISAGGGVESNNKAIGAGNAAFCVVTVPKGKTAHIVAFDGSGGPSESSSSKAPPKPKVETPPPPPSTPPPKPTTSLEPTTSSTSTTPTSTSTSTTTTPTSTSMSSTSTTTTSTSTSTTSTTTSHKKYPTVLPGIFHENSTTSETVPSTSSVKPPPTSKVAPAPATKTSDKDSEAARQQGSGAVAGLVVAFIAAACFF